MAYRVEVAVTGRAGCQATECKNAKVKIDKGELRFGSWVVIQDHGSWAWRHWGCVSGKQLQNARNNVVDPENPGVYRWDFLDGYDGDEKGSLIRHPDLQEKVRRVFTQGFIDPEDWNGDPEMNKLGESGLYTSATKKRMKEEQKQRANEIKELEEKAAALAAEREALLQKGSSTSRLSEEIDGVKSEIERKFDEKKIIGVKRVKEEDDDDAEIKEPAKKKRATKVKKEESSDEDVVKPVKKARGKKAVKQEDEEGDVLGEEKEKPVPAVKKSRGKKVLKEEPAETVKAEEESDSAAITTAPKKRAPRSKKALEKENGDQDVDDNKETVGKPPAKKGRKAAIKKEQSEETGLDKAPIKKAAPKRGRKTAVKEEPSTDELAIPENIEFPSAVKGESVDELAANDEESQNSASANARSFATGDHNSQSTQVPAEAENTQSKSKKKGGRGKRTAAPVVKSTRESLSRSALKP